MNTSFISSPTILSVGKMEDALIHETVVTESAIGKKIILHDRFCFGLVLNGTFSVSYCFREYVLKEKDLFVSTPSMYLSINTADSTGTMCYVSMLPEYFETLHDGHTTYNQLATFPYSENLLVIPLNEGRYEYLKNTFGMFAKTLGTFPLNQVGIIRHLCGLFLLQITNALYKRENNTPAYIVRSHEIYRQFKRLTIEHFREQHNLSFYADRLNMTTTYLSRVIKSVTGRTVHSILSELIFTESVKYLECSDLDIKEIAIILGFSDQSVFGKFFFKRAGMSPKKFRAQHRVE